MDASWIQTLGLIAGVQTTLAYLPQAIKVWRSRSARDVSLATLLLLASGVACWLGYGLLLDQTPIIAANAVTLVLVVAVLGLKLRFDGPWRGRSQG